MAYLTPDELRAILDPEADADDPGNAGHMSDAQLQVAIDDASAEVDGRLALKTTTPMSTPLPRLVQTIVRDIAAWRATLTDRQSEPLNPTDPVQLRYNAAQRDLEGLAAGTVALPPGLTPVAYEPTQAVAANPYAGTILTGSDAGWDRVPGGWTPPREVGGWRFPDPLGGW